MKKLHFVAVKEPSVAVNKRENEQVPKDNNKCIAEKITK